MTGAKRTALPVLGIVAHNYLRETGFLRTLEDVRVALFAPPDSALHRLADFSFPIASLDMAFADFEKAIARAQKRRVVLDGLVSWRDGNLLGVARIASRRRLPTPSPRVCKTIRSKHVFRKWLNRSISGDLQTVIETERLEPGIGRTRFVAALQARLERGGVILKPECGSCSYHVTGVRSVADLPRAWTCFRGARDYRGGAFVAETEVHGTAISVETVVARKVRAVYITQYLPRGSDDDFFETGHFVPDELRPHQREAVRRLARAIHERLGLRHTVTHTEMIVPHAGPPALVELNPRLAGDLIPELHRLVSGADLYGVAARLATGQSVPRTLLRNERRAGGQEAGGCALIRFHPPIAGRLRPAADPGDWLSGPHDRFALIAPADAVVDGGRTNDDRLAYVLLSGQNRERLDARASALLSRCVRVEPVQGRTRRSVR